jgi:hypothetical protein
MPSRGSAAPKLSQVIGLSLPHGTARERLMRE